MASGNTDNLSSKPPLRRTFSELAIDTGGAFSVNKHSRRSALSCSSGECSTIPELSGAQCTMRVVDNLCENCFYLIYTYAREN